MKYKALVRSRRGQCLSPHTASALIGMGIYYLFEGDIRETTAVKTRIT